MKKFSFLFAALFAAMSMFASEVTITPENCGWTNTAGAQEGVAVSGVTISTGNGVVGTASNVTAIRTYKNQTLTVSSTVGDITKIVITCTAKGTAQYGPGCFVADGYTFESDGKVGTWEGTPAASVGLLASTNQVRATSIVVTVADGASTAYYYLVGSMNNWEIDAAYKMAKNNAATGEEYMIDVTLEAGAEFKGRSVVDGTADAWYPGGTNLSVEIAGDYTIYLRPNGDGGADWHEGCLLAEYHEPVELPTYTCADVQANEATDEGKLNPVTVLFVRNSNIYVKDETGMTQVYIANNGLQVGDVVSGIVGHSTLYNNVPEFVPTNAPEAWTVQHGEVVYTEKDNLPTTSDVNSVYKFKDITFDQNYSFTANAQTNANATIAGETIILRNNYKFEYEFAANKIYDVVAVVVQYNGNIQLYFVSAEETGEIEPEGPEYYLVGWINGDYYGYDEDEETLGDYKFFNKRIVVTFEDEAWVLVKTGDNQKFYSPDGDVESDEENYQVTLELENEGMVRIPKNREATITISVDDNDVMTMTVTLAHSYTCAEVNAADGGTVINLNPATVVYVGEGDTRYCYLADESGMTLMFK